MYLATEPPQTMLARYVSPSAGRCQGVKTIYYRRVWGSGRLHECSAHDDYHYPARTRGRQIHEQARVARLVCRNGRRPSKVYMYEV